MPAVIPEELAKRADFDRKQLSERSDPNDKTSVDGELVVLDDTGKPSFSALQHSRFTAESLSFYAFDDIRGYFDSTSMVALERYLQIETLRLLTIQNTCA